MLHLGLFYAVHNGLLKQSVQVALPQAVMVSFILPASAPQQPAVETVALQKTSPQSKPPLPVVRPQLAEPDTSRAAPSDPPSIADPAPSLTLATANPSPAPVIAPETAAPRMISSGVEYIRAPKPEYPALSRRNGETGKVLLCVLINAQGHPEQATVQQSSGSARLDEAGRQAVLRALFKPHRDNGNPVAVYAIVPIKFTLDN
ncbi:TonB family protein [Undibacterium arcticum]|uniref:TonB family protein n=1 Tax=Undibacterium arcticum TaxID=1762892 RepID=UPI00360E3AC4